MSKESANALLIPPSLSRITPPGMERPELTNCLDTLRKNDTLLIWKLDGLGRSMRDFIEIVARLENDGIQFSSLTEDISTKIAAGKLLFHLFAVLAKFERNLIREGAMAGLSWLWCKSGGSVR